MISGALTRRPPTPYLYTVRPPQHELYHTRHLISLGVGCDQVQHTSCVFGKKNKCIELCGDNGDSMENGSQSGVVV